MMNFHSLFHGRSHLVANKSSLVPVPPHECAPAPTEVGPCQLLSELLDGQRRPGGVAAAPLLISPGLGAGPPARSLGRTEAGNCSAHPQHPPQAKQFGAATAASQS